MSLDAGRVGVRADQVDVHGRVTSPSFLNELLEDLPEWTDMPVWVNGTEELLPSNNSVPVTSPILADIAYPDIRRDNQYFTYRESPTPVDGLAKIKSIKGNTLKWNQIAEMPDTYTSGGITVTNNSDGSLTINGTATQEVNGFPIKSPWVNGHIYLWLGFPTGVKIYNQLYKNSSWALNLDYRNNPLIRKITSSADANRLFSSQIIVSGTSFNNVTYFPMEFDLTQMFGETKADEILAMETAQSGSGIAYFKSFFPLDYYPYNSGSLIPFMGNGIKTVGKNLVSLALSPASQQRVAGVTIQSQTNEEFTVTSTGSGTYSNLGLFYNLKKGTYTVKFQAEASDSYAPIMTVYGYNGGTGQVVSNSIPRNTARTFTLTEDKMVEFRCFATTTSAVRTVRFYDFQLEFGSTATSYEPYTESLLNLPISTYFPTGMKSAGTVYDELTPTKAITRIGAVNLGTLDWTLSSPSLHIFRGKLTGLNIKIPNASDLPNALLANYLPYAYSPISASNDSCFAIGFRGVEGNVIVIIDNNYSDSASFISHISGQYLFYELATPVELPTLSLGE